MFMINFFHSERLQASVRYRLTFEEIHFVAIF